MFHIFIPKALYRLLHRIHEASFRMADHVRTWHTLKMFQVRLDTLKDVRKIYCSMHSSYPQLLHG